MSPRAWVGCLACYTTGRLRGDWCDAGEAGEWRCPKPTHEEFHCFDHEGLRGLLYGECSPMEFDELCGFLDRVEHDGLPVEVVAGWLDNIGTSWREFDREKFNAAWLGAWEDGLRGFAEHVVDELPAEVLETHVVCGCTLAGYIDIEAVVRDVKASGCFEVEAKRMTYCFQPT
jgi:antirestriction protein